MDCFLALFLLSRQKSFRSANKAVKQKQPQPQPLQKSTTHSKKKIHNFFWLLMKKSARDTKERMVMPFAL